MAIVNYGNSSSGSGNYRPPSRPIPKPPSNSSSGSIYGTSSGGGQYTIGSDKGKDFINNAKPGSTLTGADGSSWTKNPDGTTTIIQNGNKYTVPGSGSNVAPPAGYPSGGSSGGSSYPSGGSSGGSSAYNPNLNRPDYSIMIKDAINSGASWNEVQDLLDKRTSIAIGDPNLNKYAYDNTWTSATDYINQKKNEEWQAQINAYYDQIAAQQEAAQRAAVSQAVNQLSGQKGDVEQSYDDLYRQLYLDRRMAEKNMPQQLAAMGISGGLSESTLLGTQTAYTDALRQGEQEKLGTLNDIDQAIANAQLTGDINIAQQAAQLAMNRLQSYGDLITQLQNQQRWAAEFAANQNQALIGNNQWQQQFNRQQMLDQMNRDDLSYDRKLQIAQYLYENTGDVSGFRSIGLTDQQIAALQSSYAAAMQQMSAIGSGGGPRRSDGGDDVDDRRYDGGYDAPNPQAGTPTYPPTPFTDKRFSMNNAYTAPMLNSYTVNTIPSAVTQELSRLESGFGASSNILAAIQRYYQNGSLTPAQVDYLLQKYNLA